MEREVGKSLGISLDQFNIQSPKRLGYVPNLVFLHNLIHLTNHIFGKFYQKESKKLVLIIYLFYCLLFGVLV